MEVIATLDTFGIIPQRFTCENDRVVLGIRQVAKLYAIGVVVDVPVCTVEK